MFRKLTIATTFLLLAGFAQPLAAASRVFIAPSFGYYYGWHPRPWYPGTTIITPLPLTGDLKIKTNDKDARVYVDGGYLGVARSLKKFTLRPGNHEIELRDARNNVLYKEKVAIVPGRTTEFDAMGAAD